MYMKDIKFLLIAILVILNLIVTLFPLFLKSLASSEFVSPQIKREAQRVKLNNFSKSEQEFWNRIKDVNFDQVNNVNNKSEIAKAEKPSVGQVKERPIVNKRPETRKPTISKTKPEKPYSRFLFVGDSVMFELGSALQSSLQQFYKINNTKLDYKISTGLNRIDYYDWYARTTKLINSYHPDVLVVMFGANEDQDITDYNHNYRVVLTEEWKKAYRERVERYAKLVDSSSVRKVYWVGLPISSSAHYNQYFSIFNKIYMDVSKTHPKIEFVSSWERFSVKGKFAPVLADKSGKRGYVKVNDGLHLTEHGAKILSDLIIDKMIKDKIIKVK